MWIEWNKVERKNNILVSNYIMFALYRQCFEFISTYIVISCQSNYHLLYLFWRWGNEGRQKLNNTPQKWQKLGYTCWSGALLWSHVHSMSSLQEEGEKIWERWVTLSFWGAKKDGKDWYSWWCSKGVLKASMRCFKAKQMRWSLILKDTGEPFWVHRVLTDPGDLCRG